LDEKWVGFSLGDFTKNVSGHPAFMPHQGIEASKTRSFRVKKNGEKVAKVLTPHFIL
jgi:O-acetylhomoserine/O-acetylserine sulfhydrylase-like pyridoxal-dependent enzyme